MLFKLQICSLDKVGARAAAVEKGVVVDVVTRPTGIVVKGLWVALRLSSREGSEYPPQQLSYCQKGSNARRSLQHFSPDLCTVGCCMEDMILQPVSQQQAFGL